MDRRFWEAIHAREGETGTGNHDSVFLHSELLDVGTLLRVCLLLGLYLVRGLEVEVYGLGSTVPGVGFSIQC